ncbi:MAG: LamG-like jellyroll fold domain-containing protein, partial [Pirellulaceae bacterium]
MRRRAVLLSIGMGLLAGLLICTGQRTASRAAGQAPGPAPVQLYRTTRGLQVLYDFASVSGPLVKDRSGNGKPIDLRIKNLQAVRRAVGSLEVRRPTVIQSDKSVGDLTTMMRRSGAITLEAWVTPANTKQEGPARILTFSSNSTNRNFTLGQEGARFDVRLRTTRTSNNGLPSVETPQRSLAPKMTHVVYTRDRAGRARIFLNGKVVVEKRIAGEVTNWDVTFRLALADELSGGRPWLGTYHLVAIYARDLNAKEVANNFRAGVTAQPGPGRPDQTARLFELQVAPLLARHCLECHDSVSRKGRLDLSRKTTALAGGESGKAIVAGKPSESLLWEQVESGEMPKNRSVLSATEKKLLKEWIARGATWSLPRIDPAVYTHGTSRQQWIRRLTVDEYIETVHSTVDVDIASEAQRILPKEIRADGFSNTAYNLNVDLKHVESYAKLAEMIVKRMDVLPFVARFSKQQKFTDKGMQDVISKMGKWILRGPLEEHEIIAYRG